MQGTVSLTQGPLSLPHLPRHSVSTPPCWEHTGFSVTKGHVLRLEGSARPAGCTVPLGPHWQGVRGVGWSSDIKWLSCPNTEQGEQSEQVCWAAWCEATTSHLFIFIYFFAILQ